MRSLTEITDGDVIRAEGARIRVEVDGMTFEFEADMVEFLRKFEAGPVRFHGLDSLEASNMAGGLASFTVLAGGIRSITVTTEEDLSGPGIILGQIERDNEKSRELAEFLRATEKATTRAKALELG